MGAVKKKVEKVMGKGSSTDSAPAPAAVATVATTTPSADGNVAAGNLVAMVKPKGKRSLLKGRGKKGGGGYNVSGGDFALFLEELMKRKTIG